MAKAAGTSRNALADRLLSEAIRTETHPLIRFQPGALGRRRALAAFLREHPGPDDFTDRIHWL
jgi:hypothetical protein